MTMGMKPAADITISPSCLATTRPTEGGAAARAHRQGRLGASWRASRANRYVVNGLVR
jgi:hypothetical protein